MPVWYMVPFEPGMPIDLWNLRWLRTTHPGPPGLDLFLYEVLDPLSGDWHVNTATDELLVDLEAPVVLIRAWSVERCPMLGFELAAIHRTLGYPSLPRVLFQDEGRSNLLRVIVWTKASVCHACSLLLSLTRELASLSNRRMCTSSPSSTLNVWSSSATISCSQCSP